MTDRKILKYMVECENVSWGEFNAFLAQIEESEAMDNMQRLGVAKVQFPDVTDAFYFGAVKNSWRS
jgi:hypothetical protein